MDQILLGIDIGTSACKAAAFTTDGRTAGQVTVPYPVYHPRAGWAEQDPEEWWTAVCRAVRLLLEQCIEARSVCAVGIDGQSGSAVAVGGNGEVLCRTPIWMDTRTAAQCEIARRKAGENRLFSVGKNPIHPMYTMPKVIWYQTERPEIYRNAAVILQSNGFVVYRLTGRYSQDHSQGYGWSCYRMAERDWDQELCRDLGIRETLLPPLAECHQIVGGVTGRAARETGLLAGTPVVAGGLDAACAALGAGVTEAGQTQEQGGQAGGMSICVDRPAGDERLILSAHVIPGKWLLQGGTVGGGAAVNWYAEEFCAAERLLAEKNHTRMLAELDRAAAKVTAGSDGLIFLPYLAGERSPVWNPQAKGVFYGIDFSKTRAHFSRAVMEGVAYSLRHNLETAKEAGAEATTLRAVGGAANSSLWMQIKADVTGKRIEVPSSDTATALGAAMLAGVGAGIYADDVHTANSLVRVRQSYEADPEHRDVYEKGYGIYRALYGNLKSIMDKGENGQ